MSRRSLRPQLNQIRGWVRQGRTDAWIAHQLEVTVQQIQAFKREQGLEPGGEDASGADVEIDLRAEDDAAIAAELEAEAARRAEEEAKAAEEAAKKAAEAEAKGESAPDEEEEDEKPKPKRSRARGGRSRRRTAGKPLEGTFDHGEEGYGLWLDPDVQDDPVYAEHWAGPPARRDHDRGGPDRDPPRRRGRRRRGLTQSVAGRARSRVRPGRLRARRRAARAVRPRDADRAPVAAARAAPEHARAARRDGRRRGRGARRRASGRPVLPAAARRRRRAGGRARGARLARRAAAAARPRRRARAAGGGRARRGGALRPRARPARRVAALGAVGDGRAGRSATRTRPTGGCSPATPTRAFAVFEHGRPLAYALLLDGGRDGMLEDVYTTPAARGRGLGDRGDRGRAARRAGGAPRARVRARPTPTGRARPLYERLGFEPLAIVHRLMKRHAVTRRASARSPGGTATTPPSARGSSRGRTARSPARPTCRRYYDYNLARVEGTPTPASTPRRWPRPPSRALADLEPPPDRGRGRGGRRARGARLRGDGLGRGAAGVPAPRAARAGAGRHPRRRAARRGLRGLAGRCAWRGGASRSGATRPTSR